MQKKKLGEILIERGVIDQDQLNSALAYQRQWGHRLGVALVAKGFITEGMLAKVLGEVMKLQVVDLARVTFDPVALRMVSVNVCENNDLIPIAYENVRNSRTLTIAMADPLNLAIIDEIEFTSGCKVRPVLATISAINSAVRKHYRGQNTVIKPLSLVKAEHTESGRMQLVRPGGAVETVDTGTRPEDSQRNLRPITAEKDQAGAPESPQEQVEAIKARRARQVARGRSGRISSDEALQDYLNEVQLSEIETLHKLEKYFWALMRVMAKKGLISKEEFMREMKE
ncbi:MAG: hypothetical protein GYA21_01140 [Myxococcales bacterium]|nr:hypothetical protein [Myxococcales bacterium]